MEEVGLRTEVVVVDFKASLEKHLYEDEVVCERCGGLGFTINDNPFGIKGYKDTQGIMFPFKKQSLSFCQSCYNGVRRKCEYCKDLIPRNPTRCECDRAKAERFVEQEKKEMDRFESAKKITLKEALQSYDMLYLDSFDKYVSTDDFEDRLEELIDEFEHDNKEKYNNLLLRIYVTSTTQLSFDAGDIIANECSDLHEESYERINSAQIEELQEMLNKWAEQVKQDTTTYWIDYSTAVDPSTL